MQSTRVWTTSLWPLLALCSEVVLASPPLPSDLSLTMRIESATDPELRPGARAIVAFDVRQFGPVIARGFVVQNPPDLIPSGPSQPLRLSELPGSNCYFGEYEDTSATPPGWYYFFTQNLPPIGSVTTCRVQIEVLEPARGGYQVSFYVESLDFDIWTDPEPQQQCQLACRRRERRCCSCSRDLRAICVGVFRSRCRISNTCHAQ